VTTDQAPVVGHIWRFESEDRMAWLTIVGLAFVIGAIALRVLGLPSVDLHGPLHRLGVMDPLCGGTRATYVLARGDIAGAWSWNPLVVLLAALLVIVVGRALIGAFTQRWLNYRGSRRTALVVVAMVLLVIEVNQQLQADRLIHVRPG
jgi:hypothetical protein